MSRTAVFPGSFDPFTKGHEHIVEKAVICFDKLIIGIGVNNEKANFLSAETRKKIIEKIFRDNDKIAVEIFDNLTVDFCRQTQTSYVVRGLRCSADFEYERQIAELNKKLAPEIETIFFLADPEYACYSSSAIRDIIKYRDVSEFLPDKFPLELLINTPK